MPQKLICFCIGSPRQGFGRGELRGWLLCGDARSFCRVQRSQQWRLRKGPMTSQGRAAAFLCSTFHKRFFHSPVFKGVCKLFNTLLVPNIYMEKNCHFLYFLKAVPLSFWHFKVFVLFCLPHLVMTSAFGKMPLTPQPFSPAVSHHNFALNQLLIGPGHLLCSVVPLNNLHATYKHFILFTGPFSFLLTSFLTLMYFPF